MPRHTLGATALWQLLAGLLAGASIRCVYHQIKAPVALESVYHLLHRLRRRLDALRVRLCGRGRPPDCDHDNPLLQTIAHLKATFADSVCPVRQFQLIFQQPLMG